MKNLNKIILSLGTNLGKREINLKDCLGELSKISNIEKVSSIYESEPLFYEEQNNFLNLIVQIDYKNTPQDLLIDIKNIEKKIGRVKTFRHGPRKIDIDIIFFNNLEIKNDQLTIPHYDWENRRFVVEPLVELFKEFDLSEYKINNQKIKKVANISNK